MITIGVRELRQQASRHLRAVQAGESIQVTEHGKPVAMIVPVPKRSALDALDAAGRLARAQVDLLTTRPVRPKKGAPLPSEILGRMRADER